jgi:hypothetical protein
MAVQDRQQLLLEVRQARAAADEATAMAKECRLACARQLAARSDSGSVALVLDCSCKCSE